MADSSDEWLLEVDRSPLRRRVQRGGEGGKITFFFSSLLQNRHYVKCKLKFKMCDLIQVFLLANFNYSLNLIKIHPPLDRSNRFWNEKMHCILKVMFFLAGHVLHGFNFGIIF